MIHPIAEKYLSLKKEGLPIHVYLKEAGHKGMGVFASKKFEKDEPIEFCHSFIFEWQNKHQRDAMVGKYCYGVNCHCAPGPQKPPCLLNCPANGNRWLMPMGFGSCYNSAEKEEEANAGWIIIVEHNLLVMMARSRIEKDDEILTWFGQGYYDGWCKAK